MNPDEPLSEADSLAVRERAIAERELALRRREADIERREGDQGRIELARAELEQHNAELLRVNEKLVLATLAADELREEAQMMRRRQDEFLAMLAHELRNPLAPIRLTVEVIAKLDDKPVPVRLLDIIRRQVSHMVRLLDDLLDASRITQGKVTLQRRLVSVEDFVSAAIETCGGRFTSKRQRLTVDLPKDAVYVHGDPVRLGQVFTNLLQNASKYTQEEGSIQLSAAVIGQNVQISVTDNGTGMSSAALPHIFDLFAQDERTLSRAQGGLGIGLTVAQKMVTLHGGTIEARSEGRGKGSEFIVTLPGVEQSGEVRALHAAGALPPTTARILLIEDNPETADILAELLRFSGHHVELANDGPGGLEIFERSQPEVVLCDIGLPGMDGYEVAQRMRASAHEPRPALIALTGYGTSKDITRALEAGFDYHLVKPAEPEALLRLVDAAAQAEDGAANRWKNSSHGSSLDEPKNGRGD